ncbi:MAG: hybrid sensor histidine kinase/response regulator [Desulfobacterales bacterium]|nr:hybrid sensor histidine kinase/response regulator [Desulfobacterales bacterium]
MENAENIMRNFKNEFRAEGLDHLKYMEKELIILEKESDPERIAAIFRSIHSIKGAAGFMACNRIVELAHLMETLLQMRCQDKFERKDIDALLSGVDYLKQMLEDLENSNKMDIHTIVADISDLVKSPDAGKFQEMLETPVRLTNGDGCDIGFDINEFNLHAVPPEKEHIYVVQFNLNDLQKQKGITPLSLIYKLLDNGHILDKKTETEADDFDHLSEAALTYQVLYATHLDSEAVKDISGYESIVIIPVCRPEPGTQELIQKTGIPIMSKEPACPEIQDTVPCKEDKEDIPDTVRIRVEILNKLMKLAGEMVQVRNNLLVMTQSDDAYRGISQRLNLVTTEMQETIMQTRMQPLDNLFAKLPRIVRDLSLKLGKKIEINTLGNEVELDKTILESLADPLTHIIRNCCDHGIEPPDARRKSGKPAIGRISVRAWHEAGHINIEISDDGQGLDLDSIRAKAQDAGLKTAEELSRMSEKEIYSIILAPGFSTAENVSDVSGRGVGMDVVRDGVERLGGSVKLSSSMGQGTCVYLRLPLTLAIIPCLLINAGGHRYAIPQSNLVELVRLRKEDVYTRIESSSDQEVFRLRDRLLPIVRLAEVLRRRTPFIPVIRAEIAGAYERSAHEVISGQKARSVKTLNIVVVKIGAKRYGLVVDQVIGVEEIVVNSIHSALKNLRIYAGTTIMGDGAVALILDIDGIAKHADVQFNLRDGEQARQLIFDDEDQTVLLFKSGPQEQFAVPLPMVRRVEHVRAASVEHVGDKEFITVDGIPNHVLRMESVLNVSKCIEKEKMLLLLPKHIRRPFGILISEVVDTLKTTLELNMDSYMKDGLLGTAVIRGHMTLFIDIYRLIELAEPEWFDERKKKAPPPERSHVLLLEDTAFFRNLVKGYLESDGYSVTAVENGQLGIEAMNEQSFDAIVSDLDMPVMNGWAFLEHIRSESSTPDIPAIALTALDSETDRVQAETVGFNAYQIKLDREELLINVSRFIRQPRQDSQ